MEGLDGWLGPGFGRRDLSRTPDVQGWGRAGGTGSPGRFFGPGPRTRPGASVALQERPRSASLARRCAHSNKGGDHPGQCIPVVSRCYRGGPLLPGLWHPDPGAGRAGHGPVGDHRQAVPVRTGRLPCRVRRFTGPRHLLYVVALVLGPDRRPAERSRAPGVARHWRRTPPPRSLCVDGQDAAKRPHRAASGPHRRWKDDTLS